MSLALKTQRVLIKISFKEKKKKVHFPFSKWSSPTKVTNPKKPIHINYGSFSPAEFNPGPGCLRTGILAPRSKTEKH